MHPIKRIYLEAGAQDYELARRVLARLPGVPVEVVPHRGALQERDRDPAGWLPRAKQTLFLAVQKGPFWRPCPGTKDYICCGYQVLQVALNCPLDCTYCILQGYLNLPAITLFVNLEELETEIEQRLTEDSSHVWRLGTGEFGDSLALDGLTGLNGRLIPRFSRYPRAVLEIKTKWHELRHLLPLGPNPRVIFAWSLNPAAIIREAEAGSATLGQRLAAARLAAEAGFRLAFHFDPIIYFPGWEDAYRETVERLARAVSARDVAWVSLGALRFLPALRRLIWGRFPGSRLAAEEMMAAPDGKLRYFRSRRVELYSRLKEWLEQALPGVRLYLCMESPRVWREVFGFSPQEGELAGLLDEQVLGPQI